MKKQQFEIRQSGEVAEYAGGRLKAIAAAEGLATDSHVQVTDRKTGNVVYERNALPVVALKQRNHRPDGFESRMVISQRLGISRYMLDKRRRHGIADDVAHDGLDLS